MKTTKSIIKQQWFQYLLATIGFFIAAKTYSDYYYQHQDNGRTTAKQTDGRQLHMDMDDAEQSIIRFGEQLRLEREREYKESQRQLVNEYEEIQRQLVNEYEEIQRQLVNEYEESLRQLELKEYEEIQRQLELKEYEEIQRQLEYEEKQRQLKLNEYEKRKRQSTWEGYSNEQDKLTKEKFIEYAKDKLQVGDYVVLQIKEELRHFIGYLIHLEDTRDTAERYFIEWRREMESKSKDLELRMEKRLEYLKDVFDKLFHKYAEDEENMTRDEFDKLNNEQLYESDDEDDEYEEEAEYLYVDDKAGDFAEAEFDDPDEKDKDCEKEDEDCVK